MKMKSLVKAVAFVVGISGLVGCNDYTDVSDGVIKKWGNAELTKVSDPMKGEQWLVAAICENTGGRVNDCLGVTTGGARFHVSKEINTHVYVRAKFDDAKPELVVPDNVYESDKVGNSFIDMPKSFLDKARAAKKRIVIEYNHAGGETETVVSYNAADFNKAVDMFYASKV
ncbi:hypothetical protein OGY20_09835 [Citrobacter sp. Cpo114]|uniref:hypothetical protein n=1 Tax=Citrobacter sp. Cpo114 TaxID=2985147 RepID=UPI000EC3452C|nr:hypothetical protein [Citrobacter sp. Cpo114]HCM57162.1 hypothetical protein [Citrobacter freundii]